MLNTFYAREDDALRQPLLGEGQALRELLGCPLVHGALLHSHTPPKTAVWQIRRTSTVLVDGHGSRREGGSCQTNGNVLGSQRGFDCSDKHPRPERRNAAEREQKQQQTGRLVSIRAGRFAQGAVCSAKWAVSMAMRRRLELMDTSAGEPCRRVDRPSPDVLGPPVIPALTPR